jgi:hypothetical protein
MKAKCQVLMGLFLLIVISGYSQEKSKKQLKEEQRLEKEKQTEALINSKAFVFTAKTAFPQDAKSINLTGNANIVKFSNDWIESFMPFFGRAYSGVGYGADNGLKFEGKPKEYTTTRTKKNYEVSVTVKGENDTYHLSLSVGLQGNASLTISSNNRSTISYNGDISAPRKE